jgi:diadenosine tetraphosphate (Ap4A) HIT family hydrolase
MVRSSESICSFQASFTNSSRPAIDESLHPDGYNVGFNDGEVAGQTVMHLHVHVIPRYRGDMEDPRGGIRHCVAGKGRRGLGTDRRLVDCEKGDEGYGKTTPNRCKPRRKRPSQKREASPSTSASPGKWSLCRRLPPVREAGGCSPQRDQG